MSPRSIPRIALAGLLSGVLLSAVRAPLGLDLLRTIAVDGTTEALFRAAALLALAVALRGSAVAGRTAVGVLAGSACLGFLAHGLAIDPLVPLASRTSAAVALVVLAAAVHAIARTPVVPGEEPNARRAAGLVLAGAGAAFALSAVAREVLLLGNGLPEEEAVTGGVFLAATGLGAAAFGGLVPAARGRELIAGALALGALACAFSMNRLNAYSDVDGFRAAVLGLGNRLAWAGGTVDVSHHGTWRIDLVLAASCLLVPGLLVGAGLAGARHGRDLAACLTGAALGTIALPLVLRATAVPMDPEGMATSSRAALWIGVGAGTAGAGAAIVALGSARGAGRTVLACAAVVAAAGPFLLDVRDPWLFSPWDDAPPVEPELALDGPGGLLTVEALQGYPVVTLDRLRMTPARHEERGDAERLRRSLALLGNEGAGARVLLVGQITPARRAALEGHELDHTCPWWRFAGPVTESLFAAHEAPPPEPVLPLAEAKRRLAGGEYDLVVVPAVHGPRLHSLAAQIASAPTRGPRRGDWSVPAGTVAVVWLDAASELGVTDLGKGVLVSARPLEEPCIGVVVGEPRDGADVLAGAPAARSLGAVGAPSLRRHVRPHAARAEVFARLAAAAPDDPRAAFLAGHYGAQRESTPFTARDDRIELDEQALADLREAALAAEPTPWLRSVIEDVAIVLREKRRPDLVLSVIQPVEEAFAPWPELEIVVLSAYGEFGMFEELLPRLRARVAADPYDLGLRTQAAEWYEQAGLPEEAAAELRAALGVQPWRPDLLRRMALLSHRHGLPEAEEWARKALQAAPPEDQELRELLGRGPADEPEE